MKKPFLKEIAKFAAGLTAWESIVHFSLATSGNIPIRLWGIRITEPVNVIQIIVPAACSVFLIYYAWFRESKTTS